MRPLAVDNFYTGRKLAVWNSGVSDASVGRHGHDGSMLQRSGRIAEGRAPSDCAIAEKSDGRGVGFLPNENGERRNAPFLQVFAQPGMSIFITHRNFYQARIYRNCLFIRKFATLA